METSQKASLGCGTLVLIAMIVVIFGSMGNRDTGEQVRQMREQVGKLREAIETQTARIRSLERRVSDRPAVVNDAAAEPARWAYFNRAATPPPPPAGWRKGVIDPRSNRLVAFWVLRKGGAEPAIIERDMGMMVIWNETARRFYLFDNVSGSYFVSEDFEKYLGQVEALPAEIALDWVDTCTASLCWQMPEESRKRLLSALARGSRQTASQNHHGHTVCTCESAGVKLLGGEAEGDTPAQAK